MPQHSPSHEKTGIGEHSKPTAVHDRTAISSPAYWCWVFKLTYLCVGFGLEFAAKQKCGYEGKRIAGPRVWSCTCTGLCDRQHHPQHRVGWSHSGRKGHGICSFFLPWRKKQGITHMHAYSPSWLLRNTTVSLQLWAPRGPCFVQQQGVIWQYQGTGRRELMKKQDKSLKLSSCHHLFPINLHLAKMDTTTDATAANCKHKMTARTINNGMCQTAKPPLQSSQMPYLHVSAKCGTGRCWREASFAVDIHTDRSSAGLTVLHGTCLVCDTVFRAAVHSDNRKSSWLSLGHKAGGPDS